MRDPLWIDQTIELQGVLGHSMLAPMAEVAVNIHGVDVHMEVAVIDDLCCDVLLGRDFPDFGRLLDQKTRNTDNLSGRSSDHLEGGESVRGSVTSATLTTGPVTHQ